MKQKKIKFKPKKKIGPQHIHRAIVNAFNMGLEFSVGENALGYHSQNTSLAEHNARPGLCTELVVLMGRTSSNH